MAKVCQLFSGSSGNSIYIGESSGGFLVDIGVSAKRCENALNTIGINPKEIRGIFITHEHSDHIAGVRVFASRHNIPVFATPETLEAMINCGAVTDKVHAFEAENVFDFGGAHISTFVNSHDSACCIGYKFEMPDGRIISVCTDTGIITSDASQSLLGSDLVFLESNHETSILENGPYPYILKKRILSSKGHLSNFAAGEFSKELIKNGTTRLVLAHLSRENNVPEIARQTSISALSEIGAAENSDYRLYISKPENDGGLIVL